MCSDDYAFLINIIFFIMNSSRKDVVVRMLTLIQRVCHQIEVSPEKDNLIIKEYVIYLKKYGGILKLLRMSPNGRISDLSSDCYSYIYETNRVKVEEKSIIESYVTKELGLKHFD